MLVADLERFPIDTKARAYLQEMVLAGCDNAKMVERLREFYRPRASREHRQAVDLNDVIEHGSRQADPSRNVRHRAWNERRDFAELHGAVFYDEEYARLGTRPGHELWHYSAPCWNYRDQE